MFGVYRAKHVQAPMHLSLVVLRATDTQLKDYLVSSIMNMTKEKELMTGELQKTVESLQQQLTCQTELLQEKTVELEHFSSDHTEQSTMLEQRVAKELGEEREKASQQLQELQWKMEREKREMETKNTRIVQQLENRVASLDVQNRDLVEIRYKHEASLWEIRGHLSSKEEELARVKMEMSNIRKEKQILESSVGDRDRRSSQLSTRLAVVEQELVDREGLVRQQKEMVRQGEEARNRMAKEIEEKTRLVEKRENTVKTVTGELLKANEIIRKLQEGVKQEQGKSKLRGQIATEQERLLVERDNDLGKCRDQLREGKELISRLNTKVADFDKKLEEKDHKIEELEKVLKTNENVINWLNKQITAQPSSLAPGPAADLPRTGPVGSKRGGRLGGGITRGIRKSTDEVQSNGTVSQQTKSNPSIDEAVTELDPKYFISSTPGGTNYRQQIPSDLPANVRRGVGLVRRIN
jgi:spindle assembly abnormal protein 6